jgi:hypothetical protein
MKRGGLSSTLPDPVDENEPTRCTNWSIPSLRERFDRVLEGMRYPRDGWMDGRDGLDWNDGTVPTTNSLWDALGRLEYGEGG